MARDTLYTSLVSWVKNYIKVGTPAASIPVIRAQENGARPSSELFATLDLSNFSPKGFASKEIINVTTNEYAYNYIGTITVSIQFYGKDALEQLEKLRATTEHEYTKSLLNDAGSAIMTQGDILDLTGLKDSRYEERGRLELVMHTTFRSTEEVNWIESVEINGETISI